MYSSSMCSSKSYVTSPSTQNSSICIEHFCFVSPEKSHKFTLSMVVPRHQHIHNILHVGAPQQDAQFFSSGDGHSPFLSNSPGIHHVDPQCLPLFLWNSLSGTWTPRSSCFVPTVPASGSKALRSPVSE